RRGDLASIEGQCPLPLQDRVQQLCVGIVENLPKCPTLDGSIYGRLRLNQWPMGYPRPQVRLMAYCFFPSERNSRSDEWVAGRRHRNPWRRYEATKPGSQRTSRVGPVPVSKSVEKLRTKPRTSPSHGPL